MTPTASHFVVDGIARTAYVSPPPSGPVSMAAIAVHGHGGSALDFLSKWAPSSGLLLCAPQGLESPDGKSTWVWPGSPPTWDMYPTAAPNDHTDLHFYRQIVARLRAAHPGVPIFHAGHSMGGMLGLEALTFASDLKLAGAWANSFGWPVDYAWKNPAAIPLVWSHGESGVDALTQRLGRALDWSPSAEHFLADCGGSWSPWSREGTDDGFEIDSRVVVGGRYPLTERWYRGGPHEWHSAEAATAEAWMRSVTA